MWFVHVCVYIMSKSKKGAMQKYMYLYIYVYMIYLIKTHNTLNHEGSPFKLLTPFTPNISLRVPPGSEHCWLP